MPTSSRRSVASIVATIIVAALLLPPPATAAPQPRHGDDRGLGKHDRELIAEARASGKSTVQLIVAAVPGSSSDVDASVRRLGGKVLYREDDISYLRVSIGLDRAERVAALSGVRAVDVDEVIALDDPRPQGQTAPDPQTPPDASTPSVNPYLPTGDIGSAQFVQAHPTWDGRGVTVGILDTGVDLAHPALATTTTGERKIVDWVTQTAPTGDEDPTWLDMKTAVTGPTFTQGGSTYTAPGASAYRFATFDERDSRLGGEVGSDVDRDGNPAGSSGLFGVLWDVATDQVWVDSDQDLSFADETAMRNYKVAYDVGYFGTDNPATPVAERMPFVVQTDPKAKFVNIGIVSGAHGTHVAGITAGNSLLGGAMSGGAPGAKIVAVRVCLFISGCTSHALIEGMVYAAKTGAVDVINMSIGGLPALNDANNARAVLYDSLIQKYNVQMFISAGNSGPGENTIGDPAVATKVVSVGSFIADATWEANYGSTAPADGTDNLHPFSSRGPREDGGFDPDIVAPGSAISTTPTWQPGGPVAGTYDLPPGYSMFNGTSMASPQAAGAGALLVSAAKATGASHKPEQLRQAILSSARHLSEYGAYEQGNGLVRVADAWSVLQANPQPVAISSSVPVDTALDQFLATPGVGRGIHDREGVTLGTPYTRTYTFVRTSGPKSAITYQLSWVGNDGTFSSASSISLPKGSPRTLTVSIDPSEYGAHSAVLNLDDPATPGTDHQTMNVVVVPYDLDAAGGFTQTFTDQVARNQARSYFVRVPAGVPALKVDFSGPDGTPGTGQARFLRFHPYGVGIDSNTSTVCYSPAVPGGSCPGGGPNSRTTSNPTAGVWEITVEARRTSDAQFTPYTLTASILGASVSPNPDVIASASVGVPVARSYTLTNLFGAFTGRAVGTTLGSAFRGRLTIADLQQVQRQVQVTPGTTSLRATIGNPSDPAADLDLFVFNCTSGTCVLTGQSADGDSEESVTVANPAAGTWVVLVDGFAVPAGSTDYDYVDVFSNPAFGSVDITDANALRPAGASWTVPGTVTAGSVPAAGRVLLGAVQVRTDTNTLVGQGDVVVESVVP
ncbi:serine protease [Nocardioides albidus]|uniref:Serine protease n=1 Tax=Nocardioides albidus TaxID=1517589 RepID=A0A5C4VYY5_9ACTN|nr:S8 family serine peptidase [Nocardioides albidus]TNM40476.1 serine protease [Nocardioides albidus]